MAIKFSWLITQGLVTSPTFPDQTHSFPIKDDWFLSPDPMITTYHNIHESNHQDLTVQLDPAL
jgi:hypothetical protein